MQSAFEFGKANNRYVVCMYIIVHVLSTIQTVQYLQVTDQRSRPDLRELGLRVRVVGIHGIHYKN